jgi:hypothetical protein
MIETGIRGTAEHDCLIVDMQRFQAKADAKA